MHKFEAKWAVLVLNGVILLFTLKKGLSIERIIFDRGYRVELQEKLWQ